jgi:hypothetical protein
MHACPDYTVPNHIVVFGRCRYALTKRAVVCMKRELEDIATRMQCRDRQAQTTTTRPRQSSESFGSEKEFCRQGPQGSSWSDQAT